jgi:ABC-type dipeptide/oligopeptide/nickel transport system permease subunit
MVLAALVLLAFVGGWLWHYSVADLTSDESSPPSWDHPFGTDAAGHDTFAQVLRGTQISIGISVLVAVFATVVGTIWGATAGYYRGRLDTVMMRIADLVLTLPLLAVAAVLGHNLGGSWWLIAVVIAGLYWAYVARVARGVVLSLREKEFVDAARSLGASNYRIMTREILPNVIGPILVYATLSIPNFMLAEAGLSFLGVGVQAPTVSWGSMLSDAGQYFQVDPTYLFCPGMAIFIAVLAFNLFGDGLRDALDPKSSR